MVWLVGTHNAKHGFRGRELLVLSDYPQATRDTVNTLKWRVTLGKNESGVLNSTGTSCLAKHCKILKLNTSSCKFPRS